MQYEKMTQLIAISVGREVIRRGDIFDGVSLLCFDEKGWPHWRAVIQRTGFGDPTPTSAQASLADANDPIEPGASGVAFVLLDRLY